MELDSTLLFRGIKGQKDFTEAFLLTNIYIMNSTDTQKFSNVLVMMKVVHATLFPYLFDTYQILTIHYSPGLSP